MKGFKAGPGTAQGIKGMAQDVAHHGGVLGELLAHAGAGVAGHMLGGEVGTLAGLFGAKTMETARSAGLKRISDIVDEALLDPAFGRALAMRAPASSEKVQAPLRAQLARIARATALGVTAGQAVGGQRQAARMGMN